MYINTPKRYRGMQRRSAFSCQRFLMIGLLLFLIAVGVGFYQMRALFAPRITEIVNSGVEDVGNWQATQFAPTPVPTSDPAIVLIDADNEWEAGRIGFALNAYNNNVDTMPNNVDVHIRIAEGYLTRGNITEATDYAERTVTANPFSSDAWATRALIYSWESNIAEGIASAQQALALDPNNVRAITYLGYAYYQAGEYDLARNRADDAIELDPNFWGGYWLRGIISENSFPYDLIAAQADYELGYSLALEQNPAMAGVVGAGWARSIRDEVFNDIPNAEEAVSMLNEMLTVDDSNFMVIYTLGYTYFNSLGQWGEAQEVFTDCVSIAPENVNCQYMLGRSLYSLDSQNAALEAFENAIENNTQYARHYWWAARAERVLGSCAAATPYLEIGYDMVINGGLPAIDEGDATLQGHFEDEMATCRIAVIPNSPTVVPEETEVVGDA